MLLISALFQSSIAPKNDRNIADLHAGWDSCGVPILDRPEERSQSLLAVEALEVVVPILDRPEERSQFDQLDILSKLKVPILDRPEERSQCGGDR